MQKLDTLILPAEGVGGNEGYPKKPRGRLPPP